MNPLRPPWEPPPAKEKPVQFEGREEVFDQHTRERQRKSAAADRLAANPPPPPPPVSPPIPVAHYEAAPTINPEKLFCMVLTLGTIGLGFVSVFAVGKLFGMPWWAAYGIIPALLWLSWLFIGWGQTFEVLFSGDIQTTALFTVPPLLMSILLYAFIGAGAFVWDDLRHAVYLTGYYISLVLWGVLLSIGLEIYWRVTSGGKQGFRTRNQW